MQSTNPLILLRHVVKVNDGLLFDPKTRNRTAQAHAAEADKTKLGAVCCERVHSDSARKNNAQDNSNHCLSCTMNSISSHT